MRIGRYSLAACAVVLTYPLAFGQVTLTPHRAPFLTASQIVAIAETETVAASLVSQAFAKYIERFPNKSPIVLGTQILEDWLPAIPSVQFQRLSDEEARAHLQQCGRLLWIESFALAPSERAGVAVAEGNQCRWSRLDVRFRYVADGWHLETGTFVGFVTGGSGCGCQ